MPINFPHLPEIRLAKPPISEVVCQVRFPPILRITKEEPSEFQELVREQFPLLSIEQGFYMKVPRPGSKEEAIAETLAKVYRFRTSDEVTSISLAVDFFALSTTKYDRWSHFTQSVQLALKATQQVYAPTQATRIGLRYINRFTPDNLGVKNIDQVLKIFQPELVAMLTSRAFPDPLEYVSQLVLADQDTKLTLRTAYGVENDEKFFVLDLDYFEEGKLSLGDLLERLQRYHSAIYDAFRWAIKDEKIRMFKPVSEEGA